MRKVVLVSLAFLFAGTISAAPKTQSAWEILKAAQTKAADQNKSIFLIFGASWCEACHQLDTFLALPDVAPIVDQHFVIAHLTFGEGDAGHPDWDTPGCGDLIAKYGGVSSSGMVALPFIAFLDAKAKLIVNSNITTKAKNKGASTGFPTAPDEIKWFLAMLEKAAPTLTADDFHKIEAGLRQAASD
jgi:hypothetical protein